MLEALLKKVESFNKAIEAIQKLPGFETSGEATAILARETIKALNAIREEVEKNIPVWQPIKTVPVYTDSSMAAENSVLLLTERGQIIEGYYTPNGSEWIAIYYYSEDDDYNRHKKSEEIFHGFNPTHWMPLPKMPTQLTEGSNNDQ